MKKILEKVCKAYGVQLLSEVKAGSKRYDFYIPTFPPIVFEVDGQQHKQTKTDNFFFKKIEQLEQYKKNDYERRKSAKLGEIVLFNFEDNEFPSIIEIEELIGQYLEKGVNEKDAYYIKERRVREKIANERRRTKEKREEFKKRNRNVN